MMIATANLNDKLIFFLGVNTGFVTDGLPDQRYIDFYRQRSSADIHCAIVGNVVVPGGHGSNKTTPTLNRNPIWSEVAEAIRASGSLPGIQLATAWAGYRGLRKFVAPTGQSVIEQARSLVQSLDLELVKQSIDSFFEAATMAVEHGFGHVQLHAAHGYLPSLLIDDRINPNASNVREQFANLAQWLNSQQVETSIRLSMKTGSAEFDNLGTEAFLDATAALPFDFVDLSSGFYNIDKRLIYPSRPEILAARLEESLAVARQHPDRRFIFSGRILNKKIDFPPNAHIGICRDLIANPNFLSERLNGCRNHGKCHYYSRGSDHVTCPRWIETIENFGTAPPSVADDA